MFLIWFYFGSSPSHLTAGSTCNGFDAPGWWGQRSQFSRGSEAGGFSPPPSSRVSAVQPAQQDRLLRLLAR